MEEQPGSVGADTQTSHGMTVADSDIIAELRRLYNRVPNANCCGKCTDSCYNVPAFESEPIVALTDPKHITRFDRFVILSENKEGKCPHLIDGKCSQYENRPLVCRLFGASAVMLCPFGCKPDRLLSKHEADSLKITAGNMERSHGR